MAPLLHFLTSGVTISCRVIALSSVCSLYPPCLLYIPKLDMTGNIYFTFTTFRPKITASTVFVVTVKCDNMSRCVRSCLCTNKAETKMSAAVELEEERGGSKGDVGGRGRGERGGGE